METQIKSVATINPSAIQAESLTAFKLGVDNLLAKRSYFISQVLPKLKEGQDYYVIMGKKSLSKGGAEKLTSIYNLTAIFEKDEKTIEMLGEIKGLVAYVCNLTKNGEIVGQGRGADTLARHGGDANKTIKMAQKRAYIDVVIRTTGLSDIFTQDLESMEISKTHDNEDSEGDEWLKNIYTDKSLRPTREQVETDEDPITPRQKELLVNLLFQKISDIAERERRLGMVGNLSKKEGSEYIKSLLENKY